MGIAKKAATHKVKKTANKAMDDAGVVGDVVDKHTTTGPVDAAQDKAAKAKKDIKKKTDKR
jgi:hypothetical protein